MFLHTLASQSYPETQQRRIQATSPAFSVALSPLLEAFSLYHGDSNVWLDSDFPKMLGAELYRPHPTYIAEMAIEPVE
jgi:hypothetical protein